MIKKSKNNLFIRTITGAILVAVLIGSMVWHPLAFSLVFYVLMMIGLREFYKLTAFNDIYPEKLLGYLVGTFIYAISVFIALEMISAWFLVFIPVLILLFFVAGLFRYQDQAIMNIAFGILPMVYITIPFSIMVFLMNPVVTGDGPHWQLIFSLFIILWSHDTFAYLTGMWLGRHKLCEKISPKKTWEGSAGGLLFGMLAAFILSLFFEQLALWQWLGAGALIIISGTLGDLSESLMKRKCNVKDSGEIFPGHGGVLDRFDALLFSAPVFFCYLILLK